MQSSKKALLEHFFRSLAIFWLTAPSESDDSRESGYRENSDGFFPPESVLLRQIHSPPNELTRLKIAMEINKIHNGQEFLDYFGVSTSQLSTHPTNFTDGVQRSNAIIPKPASCIPELQTVQVRENPDHDSIYFPDCIRLKRCGGCCNHELLSCEATSSVTHNYQIHVTKIDQQLKQWNVFEEIVALEEHRACRCECRLKAKDCSSKQIYRREECKCICKNSDEERKCNQERELKYWDLETCTCRCLRFQECSTGDHYNQNECRCKRLSVPEQWEDNDRNLHHHAESVKLMEERYPQSTTSDLNVSRRNHKEDPET